MSRSRVVAFVGVGIMTGLTASCSLALDVPFPEEAGTESRPDADVATDVGRDLGPDVGCEDVECAAVCRSLGAANGACLGDSCHCTPGADADADTEGRDEADDAPPDRPDAEDSGAEDSGCPDGGPCECTDDSDCQDGLYCNGQERCGGWVCLAALAPIECGDSDGIACTEDACDEATHECLSAPRDDWCDDTIACTSDRCDPSPTRGCLNVPDHSRCADPTPICNAAIGCVPSGSCSIDEDCQDGSFCNGRERCPAGTCRPADTPEADGTACGAGSICCSGACLTAECCSDALCSGGRCCSGRCLTAECCGDLDCTDGDACNGLETCVSGTCVLGTPVGDRTACGAGMLCCGGSCAAGDCCAASDCDDSDVCTMDTCPSRRCSHAPAADGTDCGGGAVCCGGACTAGVECCSDADCAGARCCGGLCEAVACCADLDCDNANPCDGSETCASGTCAPGTPPGDGTACGASMLCCGSTCVTGDCCAAGDCGDGSTCTSDECAGHRCSHTPLVDGTDCGGGGACCSGVCAVGACCAAGLVKTGSLQLAGGPWTFGRPTVASNGTGWGVAWGGSEASTRKAVIFRLVDLTGAPRGAEILVDEVPSSSGSWSPPVAVQWTGTEFVVAYAFSDRLRVRRIAADGTLLGAAGEVVASPSISDRIALVPLAGGFSLVWSTGGRIEVARFAGDASFVSGPTAIRTGSGGRSRVSAVAAGTELAVAWQDRPGSSNDIYFSLGTPDGTTATLTPVTATSDDDQEPELLWTGSAFRIVYRRGAALRGAHVDATGFVVNDVDLALTVYSSTQIAAGLAGADLQLTWVSSASSGTVMVGRRTDTGGTVGVDRVLDAGTATVTQPVMVVGSAVSGVSWLIAGSPAVRFGTLDAGGAPVAGSPRSISWPSGAATGRPAIAWTGTEAGLVWARSRSAGLSDLMFTTLGSDGTRRTPETALATGMTSHLSPVLVAAAAGYGLAWNGNGAQFAVLDGTGAVAGGPTRVGISTTSATGPSLVRVGSDFLVAWSDTRYTNHEVQVARLDATATVVGTPERVTTTSADSTNPFLTWTGSELVVVWIEGATMSRRIWGRRLNAAGAPLADAVELVSAPAVAATVAAGWTGSTILVVWSDERDSANSELYARTFDPTLSPLGSDVRVTYAERASASPTIVGTPYGMLLAWLDGRRSSGTPNAAFGTVLGGGGTRLGSDLLLNPAGSFGNTPVAVWTGSGALVAYAMEGAEVRTRTLGCAGSRTAGDTCSNSTDLAVDAGSVVADLSGMQDDLVTSCSSGNDKVDRVYRLTLGTERTVSVSSIGSSTTVELLDRCLEPLSSRACGTGSSSGFRRTLPAGEYYLLVEATGSSGTFSISSAPACLTLPAGDTCAAAIDLSLTGECFEGSLAGRTADYSACSASGPDVAYRIVLAERRFVLFRTLPGSGFNPILSLSNTATCSSGSTSCIGTGSGGATIGPGTYYLVVDTSGTSGYYVLSGLTLPACTPTSTPGTDSCTGVPDIPSTGGCYTSTTSGRANDFTASCGGGAVAPDVVYRLVLTARSRVVADTIGSTFDTVLHIRGISCATGTEVACNDDVVSGVAGASLIDTTLDAGTYYVVVDGYNTAAGAYTLSVRVLSP
ncbi:MAG: hypothetical protein HY905_09810 [Deltaproteobacteria bacterium]|nr:hypothetical protein [Deltaproteobacteria bacterium]